jgi:rubrerythrin
MKNKFVNHSKKLLLEQIGEERTTELFEIYFKNIFTKNMKEDYYKKYSLTKDGQFACTLCKGDGRVSMNTKHDMQCPACGGSGYLIDELKRI